MECLLLLLHTEIMGICVCGPSIDALFTVCTFSVDDPLFTPTQMFMCSPIHRECSEECTGGKICLSEGELDCRQ